MCNPLTTRVHPEKCIIRHSIVVQTSENVLAQTKMANYNQAILFYDMGPLLHMWFIGDQSIVTKCMTLLRNSLEMQLQDKGRKISL
jgi:hypothetical protein